MKLSDIWEAAEEQKAAVGNQPLGLERDILPELPDIQSHALVVGEFIFYNMIPVWKWAGLITENGV